MAALTLVIGNKTYSSWSLRPWMLLKHVGVPFSEEHVSLYGPDTHAQILRHSPSGRVPVLIDGATRIWESLAICEYIGERFPAATVWPRDLAARAVARAVSNEMHAGFAALRSELPMNCRSRQAGVVPSAAAQADIERIVAIWCECRASYGSAGPWLFGTFTIADAMFAPVATRFWTYGVALPDAAAAYVATMMEDPPMREWMAAARAESDRLPDFERGTPLP